MSANVEGEQIIGAEYRLIERQSRGLGSTTKVSDVKMRYKGGTFYGDTTVADDDSHDGEEDDMLRDVVLATEGVKGSAEADS